MPSPPWHHSTGLDGVLDTWLRTRTVAECLVGDHTLPPAPARLAPLPAGLGPGLVAALAQRGIRELYSHQAAAIAAARSGRHVVIATPTASGKSLCFHLPVLERLATDPGATALYLYPTKALSRDQEHGIQRLVEDAGLSAPAMVYDGDTPGDARRSVRERCRIVLSNPDMLHSGILPNHPRWASLLRGLRYVVVDELHTYRGVFGSHMAHVLGRLRRLARFHGADPVFIMATATIGNPHAHAARLLALDPGAAERELVLVGDSGAPSSNRRIFVYNPPIINAELGTRQSALDHTVRLTADLVRARVPSIVFGRSRTSVELMLKYLRERCADALGGAAAAQRQLMAYRGGYLPGHRREIERGLREGEVLCVVATNALELGIDIGDLDAVLTLGYPGSVAAAWQRFGRAGRRGRTSVAVMVCSSEAIDQYLALNPGHLLRAGAEEARIDASNPEVLLRHLECAAFEAPFEVSPAGDRPRAPLAATGEAYAPLDVEETRQALDYLAGNGLVHAAGGRYHWCAEGHPATHVSLRNIGWHNFVIIDVETERTLAELDWRAAHTMLHEQAIYQHDADQYQVERLDYDNHKAFVRRVAPDYFTTALTYRTVGVLEQERARLLHEPADEAAEAAPHALGALGAHAQGEIGAHALGALGAHAQGEIGAHAQGTPEPRADPRPHTSAAARADARLDARQAGRRAAVSLGFGDVKVLEKVTGYKKIKFFTHENAGYGDVHLPEMQMHTTAFWLTFPEAFVERAGGERERVIDAIRGIATALETVATVALMCEPSDLGRTLGDGPTHGPDGPTHGPDGPTHGPDGPTHGPDASGVDSAELAKSSEPAAPPNNHGSGSPFEPLPAGRDPFARRTGQLDPTVFLFDAHPGGVGLAERIFERAEELLEQTRALVRGCPCKGGCPACLGPGSGASHKALALRLLDLLGAPATAPSTPTRPLGAEAMPPTAPSAAA